jgi:hypothetical protein
VGVVVPRGAGRWLSRRGVPNVEELGEGEQLVDGDLTITATHAAHSGHRWGPRLTHGPHAPALGHVPFEPHVGSHGGMGGPQARGFLVYPKSFRPPGGVVGAEALHQVLRGWLTDLGHPTPSTHKDDVSLAPQPS